MAVHPLEGRKLMSHHDTDHMKRATDANVAVVKKALDAWASGDAEAAAAVMTDDIEWHEIGNPNALHGKAALAERFNQPDAQSWSMKGDTHDVVANEDHAIALVTATATQGDRSLTYKVAEIYHIRDGKISARWAFSDDTEAINKFFGGA
jgi:ketosteroid isomerase-like protein